MKTRIWNKKLGLTAIASATGLLNTVAAANYINPFTSEGQRANAPKMDEQWTWIIAGVVILLVVVIAMILTLQNRINAFVEKEESKKADPEVLKHKSTWKELFIKPERDRPLDAPIEGHNYDGIVELDNNPPAWFNWLFFLPIAWGFCYIMYFHVLHIGELQDQEYATEVKLASAGSEDKETALADAIANITPLTAAADLERGKDRFKLFCSSCHKDDGRGATGPNLSDKYWIHGGDFKSVFNTIYNGVPEKGMVAWKKQLSFDDIQKVASYIHTEIRNTNAEGGKDPEGEPYEGN
ncbi:MAG: c-type cytochrome [Bacteroidetes bacterium]|nr:c-type cytochrome [Bacteroidota bacterium]